jgi:4-hydroxythreonine-4-phosphate dehydrogenase
LTETDRPPATLAITMGDPAGVGPEIAARVLADVSLRRRCRPVLIGSMEVFQVATDLVGEPLPLTGLTENDLRRSRPGDRPRRPGAEEPPSGTVGVVTPTDLPAGPFPRGVVDATSGRAAYACIAEACRLAELGLVDAIVTNPIHKKALRLGGCRHAGHTEILRDLTGSASSAMMLVEGDLRVVHVTTHCSLAEAIGRCTVERIVEVTRLADEALRRLGIERPRLAMAALNPHAGDDGLFGDEERTRIAPACRVAREEGIDVTDPLPADTIFSLAVGGRFDAVIAQYHDQGHIPVKLLGFRYDHATGTWDSVAGINVTLGLPILRVSVDHGTAFDQAWRGTASPDSLRNAIDFAIRMTNR